MMDDARCSKNSRETGTKKVMDEFMSLQMIKFVMVMIYSVMLQHSENTFAVFIFYIYHHIIMSLQNFFSNQYSMAEYTLRVLVS